MQSYNQQFKSETSPSNTQKSTPLIIKLVNPEDIELIQKGLNSGNVAKIEVCLNHLRYKVIEESKIIVLFKCVLDCGMIMEKPEKLILDLIDLLHQVLKTNQTLSNDSKVNPHKFSRFSCRSLASTASCTSPCSICHNSNKNNNPKKNMHRSLPTTSVPFLPHLFHLYHPCSPRYGPSSLTCSVRMRVERPATQWSSWGQQNFMGSVLGYKWGMSSFTRRQVSC